WITCVSLLLELIIRQSNKATDPVNLILYLSNVSILAEHSLLTLIVAPAATLENRALYTAMQLNSANSLPENEYDNKLARCLSNGIVKCLGGLSIGLLTTVIMAKCMSLGQPLFSSLSVYFKCVFESVSDARASLKMFAISLLTKLFLREIGRRYFLSIVMFNLGRTWPMWLGTGVGLGIAYSDCDYDYRKGTVIRGKLIKKKPDGGTETNRVIVVDADGPGRSTAFNSLPRGSMQNRRGNVVFHCFLAIQLSICCYQISFTSGLSGILANPGEDPYIRQAAGLQLKNVLVSKDAQLKQQCIKRWLSIPENVRTDIKTNVLNTIGTETTRPSIAAQCIAAIAFAELPRNSWPECVFRLTNNVTNANSSEILKASSLEALGYMCQDIHPSVLADSSNVILTAIVHGMRQEETSNYVRLVATEALYNSLEFTRSNFENEWERNVIMEVVCNCTQSSSVQVKVLALQCLVKIVSLYYDYMEVYMKEALFSISVEAMRSSDDEVVLQGIEFWSNVCDEELDLAVEATEAAEKGALPAHQSRHYAKGALTYVLPILLETLARQEENDDEEEWVPSKAAGVCIMLLAQCVGDDVVRLTLPFIASNFQHKDWRRRDAALMAFGSILDGPDHDNLLLLVREGFSVIVNAFKDEQTAVRDTAAWAIGRVCEFCCDIVSQKEFLDSLLPLLCDGLSQEPRVAANICWSISNLATSIHQDMLNFTSLTQAAETSVLSGAFENLVGELFKVTDRRDAHQSNLRIAAYEALMELIKMSPVDCYKTVQSIVVGVTTRLDHLLGMGAANVSNVGEVGHYDDLQALLCATLQTALRRLELSDLIEMSDGIMVLLLRLIGANINRSSVVTEEALMACTVLIEAIGKEFLKYFGAFKPYVIQALTKTSDTQVCIAAVGVVDDLSRNLEKEIVPHMPDFMACLVAILRNPESDKNLKCVVISVFGDMALAAETEFVPFLPTVVQALMEALAIEVDVTDFDQVDYVNSLRQNCIESFTSILQSLRSSDEAVRMLHPYATEVINYIAKFSQCPEISHEMMTACAGTLGDLAQVYRSGVADALKKPGILELLRKGRSMRDEKAASIFNWTYSALSQLMPID
ncbi:hypothetical protein M513_00346, partial [Trichuris suis]